MSSVKDIFFAKKPRIARFHRIFERLFHPTASAGITTLLSRERRNTFRSPQNGLFFYTIRKTFKYKVFTNLQQPDIICKPEFAECKYRPCDSVGAGLRTNQVLNCAPTAFL